MIYIDANVFIRALVQPVTRSDVTMAAQAVTLFRRAGRAEVGLTTSETIVAEVVFILSNRHHYDMARQDVRARLRPLLLMRGCRFDAKRLCLRALDLWEQHPTLSFPDSLSAAYSELEGHELATFDRDLGALLNVKTFQW